MQRGAAHHDALAREVAGTLQRSKDVPAAARRPSSSVRRPIGGDANDGEWMYHLAELDAEFRQRRAERDAASRDATADLRRANVAAAVAPPASAASAGVSALLCSTVRAAVEGDATTAAALLGSAATAADRAGGAEELVADARRTAAEAAAATVTVAAAARADVAAVAEAAALAVGEVADPTSEFGAKVLSILAPPPPPPPSSSPPPRASSRPASPSQVVVVSVAPAETFELPSAARVVKSSRSRRYRSAALSTATLSREQLAGAAYKFVDVVSSLPLGLYLSRSDRSLDQRASPMSPFGVTSFATPSSPSLLGGARGPAFDSWFALGSPLARDSGLWPGPQSPFNSGPTPANASAGSFSVGLGALSHSGTLAMGASYQSLVPPRCSADGSGSFLSVLPGEVRPWPSRRSETAGCERKSMLPRMAAILSDPPRAPFVFPMT